MKTNNLTLEKREEIAFVLDTFPLTEGEEQEVMRQSQRMFEEVEKNLTFMIDHSIKEFSIDYERKAMRRLIIDRIFNKHMVRVQARLEAIIRDQSLR